MVYAWSDNRFSERPLRALQLRRIPACDLCLCLTPALALWACRERKPLHASRTEVASLGTTLFDALLAELPAA